MKQKAFLILCCLCSLALATYLPLVGQSADAAQAAPAKRLGTVKAITGNLLTLTTDSGADIAVTVMENASILRLNAGDKDLKNATHIELRDLAVGDKVRVRGRAVGEAIDALEVLVITSSAVDAVRDQVRLDWQKRGVWGLVESVNPAEGTIKLSIPSIMNKRALLIRATKNTIIHRYAPDSPKPEDAKPATLTDIHEGDQLRARGNRNAEGSELTAEEIFTGVFPEFDAVVKSIDATAGTLSVQDLKSKKIVQLRVAADSQLHKVPPEMAQRMAGFFKAAKAGVVPGMPGTGQPSGSSGGGSANARAGATAGPGPATGFRRMGGGGMDMQRMLDQAPAVQLAELHKGDAVAVLATEGTPTGANTVVKLFSGVEPIFEAAPSATQAMMLTPWSLGGAPTGESQ